MKKNSLYTSLILILLCIFLIPSLVKKCDASVNHYVAKYKQIEATPKQLKNLTRYDHFIKYYSKFSFFKPKHRVHPDFIRALILSESDANPRAKSNKLAVGLTQILYETGKIAAAELYKKNIHFKYINRKRLKNLTQADLYDPAINILLAYYLIGKYNYAFNGRLDLVVSAWNAGENSIRNNKPPQYKETLNLVGKINGYFVYFLKRNRRRIRIAG